MRRKLKEYYEQDGAAEKQIIQFRTGSYVPVFVLRQDVDISQPNEMAAQSAPITMQIEVSSMHAQSQEALSIEFAYGLTEEVLHHLAGIRGISITHRDKDDITHNGASRAVPFMQISGTVRYENKRVFVALRVVTVNGIVVLSQKFEHHLDDGEIREFQKSVVIAFINRLNPEFSANTHLVAANCNTFEQITAAVVAAEGLLESSSIPAILEAVQRLEQLAKQAPDYARIYCSLGKACQALAVRGALDRADFRQKGIAACEKALQLDPEMSECHATLACLVAADWQWDQAEKICYTAIKLSDETFTRYLYASVLLMANRWKEAWYNLSISAAVDPLSPRRRTILEGFRYYNGQFKHTPAGQWRIKRFEDLPAESLLFNAMGEIQRGAYEQALAIASYIHNQHPHVAVYLGAVAEIYALCGKPAEAEAIIARAKLLSDDAELSDFRKAGLCISRGLKSEAVRWLERSFERRESDLIRMYCDPRFAALYDNKSFHAIGKGVFGTWRPHV